MVHHIENPLAIMNVYVQSQMYLCDFVCVFKGEREQEGEGFYSPVFPCMYESQRVHVCVCVSEWM